MRGRIAGIFLIAALFLPASVRAADGKVVKVFSQYLDLQGRHALSPSLFERDAYQARLRKAPGERSGIRLLVEWKGSAAQSAKLLTLKVEMRGVKGRTMQNLAMEKEVSGHRWFGNWSEFRLTGDNYHNFGELVAWRASLWQNDREISELESFLWSGVPPPRPASSVPASR